MNGPVLSAAPGLPFTVALAASEGRTVAGAAGDPPSFAELLAVRAAARTGEPDPAVCGAVLPIPPHEQATVVEMAASADRPVADQPVVAAISNSDRVETPRQPIDPAPEGGGRIEAPPETPVSAQREPDRSAKAPPVSSPRSGSPTTSLSEAREPRDAPDPVPAPAMEETPRDARMPVVATRFNERGFFIWRDVATPPLALASPALPVGDIDIAVTPDTMPARIGRPEGVRTRSVPVIPDGAGLPAPTAPRPVPAAKDVPPLPLPQASSGSALPVAVEEAGPEPAMSEASSPTLRPFRPAAAVPMSATLHDAEHGVRASLVVPHLDPDERARLRGEAARILAEHGIAPRVVVAAPLPAQRHGGA